MTEQHGSAQERSPDQRPAPDDAAFPTGVDMGTGMSDAELVERFRSLIGAGNELPEVWALAVEEIGRAHARELWWMVLGGYDGQAQT